MIICRIIDVEGALDKNRSRKSLYWSLFLDFWMCFHIFRIVPYDLLTITICMYIPLAEIHLLQHSSVWENNRAQLLKRAGAKLYSSSSR